MFVKILCNKDVISCLSVKNNVVKRAGVDSVRLISEPAVNLKFKETHKSVDMYLPYIIKQDIEKATDGDVIMFTDGGINISGLDFVAISEVVKTQHIVCEHTDVLRASCTKKNAYDFYEQKPNNTDMLFNTSTICFMVNEMTRQFFNEWYDVCVSNPELYDDTPSLPNSKDFIGTYGPITLFTTLLHKYKLVHTINWMDYITNNFFTLNQDTKPDWYSELEMSNPTVRVTGKVIHFKPAWFDGKFTDGDDFDVLYVSESNPSELFCSVAPLLKHMKKNTVIVFENYTMGNEDTNPRSYKNTVSNPKFAIDALFITTRNLCTGKPPKMYNSKVLVGFYN